MIKILNAYTALLNKRIIYGFAPILLAIHNGNSKHLRKRNIDSIYFFVKYFYLENEEVTKLLIENGADVNVKFDEKAITILHRAAEKGKRVFFEIQ